MGGVADDDPRWRQSAFGYGCNAAERMDPPPRSLARRSVWLLHGQHPIRVQPNTSVVRAIDRGQWQAPLGSSRGPTIRLLAACPPGPRPHGPTLRPAAKTAAPCTPA